jgi:hypothetical protein
MEYKTVSRAVQRFEQKLEREKVLAMKVMGCLDELSIVET